MTNANVGKDSTLADTAIGNTVGLRGSAVERQSLAGVFWPSCARPVADG